jgi:hypothetical protein
LTSQLPWPDSFLLPRSWSGVSRLVARIVGLADQGRLPATLLLVGEAGLGREAAAIEAAAGLVCRQGGTPGCTCASCERVRRGLHPDVEVIDVLPGKSEILIDEQVRPFTAGLERRPFEGRRRVTVIASCHTPPLNVHSASALLKTLEEPPAHATLLLLAGNPARVLPTILSRAVQVRVPSPSEEEKLSLVAAHRSLATEEAAALLAATDGDAWAALASPDDDAVEQLRHLRELTATALDGDPLALVRLGAAVKALPAGTLAVVSHLVELARETSGERAEDLLDAAAHVLRAERRHLSLHLDLESAIVGSLARVVSAAMPS